MNLLTVLGRVARRPLVVGMMVGLIVNLSLTPLLRAPEARAQPAQVKDAAPVIDGDYIRGVQVDIFGQLFESEWSEADWTYPLSEEVDGLGTYQGLNYLGQEFEFQAYFVAQLDMGSLDLDPAGQEIVSSREMAFTSVAGKLRTGLAELPVHGTVVSYLNNQGVREVHFMCTDYVDADSAIFWDPPVDPVVEYVMAPRAINQAVSTGGTGDDDCAAACQAQYNAAVAAAESAYQIAVNLAAATLAISIGLCNATFTIAKNNADQNLAICLLAATAAQTICTIASLGCGWFVLGCVLLCKAGYAVAVAACIAYHKSAMTAAAAALAACTAAANATYAATVAAAAATRAAAIQAAEQALQNCLQGCPGAGGNTEIRQQSVSLRTAVVVY